MIPQKITLYNFMSYRGPQTLDMQDISMACISGNNGVGKSTLLEAITWACWGKTRSQSDDELINQNAHEMWVEFEFRIEKNRFRIVRKRLKRKHGTSELHLISLLPNDQKIISEPTIKQTQAKIENIIKIPYSIYINSAYLKQGRADEFTIKSPAERKDILADILELEKYEKLQELAKEHLKKLELTLQNINYQIELAKSDLGEKDKIQKNITKRNKEISQLVTDLQKKMEETKIYQENWQKYQLENQKYIHLQEKYQEVVKEIKNLILENSDLKKGVESQNFYIHNKEKIKKDYENLKNLERQEKDLTKNFYEITKLKEKLQKIQEYNLHQQHTQELKKQKILSILENEKVSLDRKLQRIKKLNICPTCLRKMTQTDKVKTTINLRDEFLKIKKQYFIDMKKIQAPYIDQNKIDQINSHINKIDYNKEKHNKIISQIQKLKKVEEDILNLNKIEIEKENLQKNIEKNNQLCNNKKITLIKIKKQGNLTRKSRDNLAPYQEKYHTKVSEVNSTRENLSNIKSEIAAYQEKLSQIIKAENIIKQGKKSQKEIIKKNSTLEFLSLIFSKKGIPSMIIQEAIPRLEDESNKILEKITNGQLRIKFQTKRPKKISDEVIETLDILISDDLGFRNYELYSGGEAFRINFAIRIGLSKLLAERAGAKLKFLAIDEGFGTQDEVGKLLLIEVIKSIQADFEKIIVITHAQELKDMFPQRIDVYKDKTGSHLQFF